MAETHKFLNSGGTAQPQNLLRVQVLCVLVVNLTLNFLGSHHAFIRFSWTIICEIFG